MTVYSVQCSSDASRRFWRLCPADFETGPKVSGMNYSNSDSAGGSPGVEDTSLLSAGKETQVPTSIQHTELNRCGSKSEGKTISGNNLCFTKIQVWSTKAHRVYNWETGDILPKNTSHWRERGMVCTRTCVHTNKRGALIISPAWFYTHKHTGRQKLSQSRNWCTAHRKTLLSQRNMFVFCLWGVLVCLFCF